MVRAAALMGLGVLVMLLKKACELVLEKEYSGWASALARLMVRCAGLVCPDRRSHWTADVAYDQQVLGQSGLVAAAKCIAGAPRLRLQAAVERAKSTLVDTLATSNTEEHPCPGIGP